MASPLWTIADRDAVKAAYLALATGKRAIKVSFTGAGAASRDVEYQAADMPALLDLLAVIQRAVGGAAPFRLAGSRKGLSAGTPGGSSRFGDVFGDTTGDDQ
jgi:hypothetical protein